MEYFGGNIFQDESLVTHEKKIDLKNNISFRPDEAYKQ